MHLYGYQHMQLSVASCKETWIKDITINKESKRMEIATSRNPHNHHIVSFVLWHDRLHLDLKMPVYLPSCRILPVLLFTYWNIISSPSCTAQVCAGEASANVNFISLNGPLCDSYRKPCRREFGRYETWVFRAAISHTHLERWERKAGHQVGFSRWSVARLAFDKGLRSRVNTDFLGLWRDCMWRLFSQRRSLVVYVTIVS
jgi:hypothetical protein